MTDGKYFENVFRQVWGEALGSDERERLLLLQKALEVHDNDALWAVLIALQYHVRLYEKIPDRIADAAEEAVKQVRETAKMTTQAAAAEVLRTLAQEVSRTASAIASRVHGRELAQWAVIATFVLGCVISGIAWYMHRMGCGGGLRPRLERRL